MMLRIDLTRRRYILVGVLLISLGLVSTYIYRTYYSFSKGRFNCYNVAVDYLNAAKIRYHIQDFGEKQWAMAIDVETDIYNLCMIGLDEQTLRSFKSTVMQKYQK